MKQGWDLLPSCFHPVTQLYFPCSWTPWTPSFWAPCAQHLPSTSGDPSLHLRTWVTHLFVTYFCITYLCHSGGSPPPCCRSTEPQGSRGLRSPEIILGRREENSECWLPGKASVRVVAVENASEVTLTCRLIATDWLASTPPSTLWRAQAMVMLGKGLSWAPCRAPQNLGQ